MKERAREIRNRILDMKKRKAERAFQDAKWKIMLDDLERRSNQLNDMAGTFTTETPSKAS